MNISCWSIQFVDLLSPLSVLVIYHQEPPHTRESFWNCVNSPLIQVRPFTLLYRMCTWLGGSHTFTWLNCLCWYLRPIASLVFGPTIICVFMKYLLLYLRKILCSFFIFCCCSKYKFLIKLHSQNLVLSQWWLLERYGPEGENELQTENANDKSRYFKEMLFCFAACSEALWNMVHLS